MMMANVKIEQVEPHSFVVIADTEKYGKGAILFQDITRQAAESYIKANDPRATWTYKPLEPRTTLTPAMVPEYVKELVKGFEFATSGDYNPGYTILIRKPRPYMTVPVWRKKIEKLVNWAFRYGADATIDRMPIATRHNWQWARVTITDPVMRILEQVR